MDATVNTLNWFEIPATDINRAVTFYETVFGIKMSVNEMMGMKMAGFPMQFGNGKVSGAIVMGPMHQPSRDGVIVYFNGNPDLAGPLGKVEAAGGQILMPKTAISPEIGFMAIILDSEGNRVAMHSQQ